MDVVLRTSYGEAEISLRNTSDQSTLADIVMHVTGQHSPPIVFVDGRALPATTSLEASGMLHGSTVATSEREETTDTNVVEIVQIAGRGAGATASLPAGRFVLGNGRRANAAELDFAPVDHPSFEMIVDNDGGVRIRARGGSTRLDGREVDVSDALRWSTGTLDSGNRVFHLSRRAASATPAARPTATPVDQPPRRRRSTAHGLVSFNRPPRRVQSREIDPITSSETDKVIGHHGAERDRRRSEQPDIGDLINLTRDTDPRLWERRPGDDDVFRVAIGLADIAWSPRLHVPRDDRAAARLLVEKCGPLPMVPVSINLAVDNALAVIGQSEFVSDLARGLILGAAVTHGPADLDIVVLTNSDRISSWEWAKWLPHTRTATRPQVFATEEEIRTWIDSLEEAPSDLIDDQEMPDHMKLVVIDDALLWRDRDSPLRPLISNVPTSMHILVLADVADGPPAACSAVISQDDDLSISIDWIQERRRVGGIRAFFASVEVATTVALALAPLDDPELPAPNSDNPPAPVSLFDLLGLDRGDAGEFAKRWSNRGMQLSTAVGISAQGTVSIDLVDDGPHGLIAGEGADDLLQTLIVGLAANCAPDELSLILFDFTEHGGLSNLHNLPHTVWTGKDLDSRRAARMLRCLRAEVSRREADAESKFPHLLLAVSHSETAAEEFPAFLTEIIAIVQAERDVGVHLLVATELAETAIERAAEGTFHIRIDANATQTARSDQTREAGSDGGLDVVPFVLGRELSPMEHRLNRTGSSATDVSLEPGPSSAQVEIAAAMKQASEESNAPRPRTICPDPLPSQLSLHSFFDDHPGDGVPFALVDRPDEQSQEVAWWRPEIDEGLLIIGPEGSGKTSLLVSLALGIGERYSAEDLHLYCFNGSDHRLDQLARLPHSGGVTHADDPEATARLVEALQHELDRRIALRRDSDAQPLGPEHPTIVAMVDHADGLGSAVSTFQQMLDYGPSVRMHAVITSSGPNGFAASVTAESVRRVTLGTGDSSITDPAPAGRAHREDGNEMQLVNPPSDLAAALAGLNAEPTNSSPSLGKPD